MGAPLQHLLGLGSEDATPPTTTLVLIRHGHTQDNTPGASARLLGWTDAPLSRVGREQVRLLCLRLKDEPPDALPDALYTSPLRRARDTAAAVGAALGMRPRLHSALREIHCGTLDGRQLLDVQREYPDLWRRNMAQADDAFRWPRGESYSELRTRCLDAVQWIATAHPDQRVAVVTHTGFITQVLGALRGTAAARWDAFRAGNASLTEVSWTGCGGTVETFDDRRHLARRPPSAAPDDIGAAQHTQLVVGGAQGIGATA